MSFGSTLLTGAQWGCDWAAKTRRHTPNGALGHPKRRPWITASSLMSLHTPTPHATCRTAGADRLTQREAELCAGARMLPSHYLSLKDVMMRDAAVHGHISRSDVSVMT